MSQSFEDLLAPEPARQACSCRAGVEELRDRDLGKPQDVVQPMVGEQPAVRGDPGAVDFDLDPAIASGSQKGLFGFTLPVSHDHVLSVVPTR
jgi:hypothetical protein